MPSNCAFPHCPYSEHIRKKNNLPKRSLFIVRRPDLGKTPEERDHRQKLCDILVKHYEESGKVPQTDFNGIHNQLHRESAAICEIHFKEEDIIFQTKRRKLRLGALPVVCMPEKKESIKRKRKKRKLPWKERKRLEEDAAANPNETTEKEQNSDKKPVVLLKKLPLSNEVGKVKSRNKRKHPKLVEILNNAPYTCDADENTAKDNTPEDKRSMFEKLMYKLIHLLKDFCSRAFTSLERVFLLDEVIDTEFKSLLSKVSIVDILNAVTTKLGTVADAEVDQIAGEEVVKDWLEMVEEIDEERHVGVATAEHENTDRITDMEREDTVKANIPLEQIVFHTAGLNNFVPPHENVPIPTIVQVLHDDETDLGSAVAACSTTGVKEIPITEKPLNILAPTPSKIPPWVAKLQKKHAANFKQAQRKREVTRPTMIETKLKNQQDKLEYDKKYKYSDEKLGTMYKCHTANCRSKFKKWYELRQHIRIHTGELNTKCTVCGKVIQKPAMKSHMMLHTKTRRYNCEECGLKFSHGHHLKRHQLNKTACRYLSFQCELCKKQFREVEEINEHFVSVHCGKDTQCNKCGNVFSKLCATEKHQLKLLKPYKCDKCNTCYSFRTTLKRHLREDHVSNCTPKKRKGDLDEEANFVCEECSKTFKTYEQFYTHKQTHLKQTCKVCDKDFKSLSSLTKHRHIHTKPFKCEKCLGSFAEREFLNTHSCLPVMLDITDKE